MKVLYAVSEARPFAASGGLADVAGSLPQALRKRLIGCRVVMPLYESVPKELRDKMKFITHIIVPVAWRSQYCGIYEAKHGGVIYYLLDNQYYFKRDNYYAYYDDAERFAFFSRAVLEILPHIGFFPDVIHCNDWQTALTPVYQTCIYSQREEYQHIKTLFTIHNIQYQGVYGREILHDVLGLSDEHYSLLEYDGAINLMKGGIECANMVTTVSPTYAKEILDPWYSHGLDSILVQREWKLKGILNGIDTEYYNPETDTEIAANYSALSPENKKLCKAALQKEMGLPETEDTPLIGIVSRLVGHKGFDLVKAVLEEILEKENVQLAVLGSGEGQYEGFFKEMHEKYPEKLGVCIGFNPALAKRIYAGADIFLMPSKSEPCGLAQMVALRYGTVPIVRATGGLKDSIFDNKGGDGNGFVFENYNAEELKETIYRALQLYKDQKEWRALRTRAFESDCSWGKSANEYIKVYKQVIKQV